jgi:hypothetical protein
MSDGDIYLWAVATTLAVGGTHWHAFRTRRLARAFAAKHHGKLYRVVEAH